MISRLLLNGILIGILAGVVSFGVLHVFVEPQMERAIAFEEQEEASEAPAMVHAEHSAEEHSHKADEGAHVHGEVISREIQAGVGALVATTVFGGAVGGLFSLVFCFMHGRVGKASPQALSLAISAGALLAFVILPTLKYPATPPGVGLSGTIGERTSFYFILLVGSLLLQTAYVMLYRKLKNIGINRAMIFSVGGYVLSTVIMLGLLPSVNEVPSAFSNEVLWGFRVSSVVTQATLWIVIGLAYGWYAQRTLSNTRMTPFPANS